MPRASRAAAAPPLRRRCAGGIYHGFVHRTLNPLRRKGLVVSWSVGLLQRSENCNSLTRYARAMEFPDPRDGVQGSSDPPLARYARAWETLAADPGIRRSARLPFSRSAPFPAVIPSRYARARGPCLVCGRSARARFLSVREQSVKQRKHFLCKLPG